MSAITHPNHPSVYAVLGNCLSQGIAAAADFLFLVRASSELAVRVESGHKVTLADLRKVGLL